MEYSPCIHNFFWPMRFDRSSRPKILSAATHHARIYYSSARVPARQHWTGANAEIPEERPTRKYHSRRRDLKERIRTYVSGTAPPTKSVDYATASGMVVVDIVNLSPIRGNHRAGARRRGSIESLLE